MDKSIEFIVFITPNTVYSLQHYHVRIYCDCIGWNNHTIIWVSDWIDRKLWSVGFVFLLMITLQLMNIVEVYKKCQISHELCTEVTELSIFLFLFISSNFSSSSTYDMRHVYQSGKTIQVDWQVDCNPVTAQTITALQTSAESAWS